MQFNYICKMKPLTAYPKHKRKKLYYIRVKYALIRGFTGFGTTLKVSNQIRIDELKGTIDEVIHNLRKRVFTDFKITLSECVVNRGTVNDDILNDLTTIQIEIFNKKAND